jgi:hypothetical protein
MRSDCLVFRIVLSQLAFCNREPRECSVYGLVWFDGEVAMTSEFNGNTAFTNCTFCLDGMDADAVTVDHAMDLAQSDCAAFECRMSRIGNGYGRCGGGVLGGGRAALKALVVNPLKLGSLKCSRIFELVPPADRCFSQLVQMTDRP